MYKSNTNCKLGCNEEENQEHIFTKCEKVKNELSEISDIYNYIFESVDKQKQAAEVFTQIDKARNDAMKRLPGDNNARTLASFTTMQQTVSVVDV